MNYEKINKRIEHMLENDKDDTLLNINLGDDLSKKLFDYQLLHVFNLICSLTSKQVTIDGSDTGTGKTYAAISACRHMKLRPFIICPKIIMNKWKDVCNYFDVRPISIVNYEAIKYGKEYFRDERVDSRFVDIIVENTNKKSKKTGKLKQNIVDYKWNLPKNAIIIFDEAHKCKNIKSKNGILLISTKGLNNKVLLLSATLSDTPSSFHVFGYMLGFYKTMRQAKNWINGMIIDDNNYIGHVKKLSSINRKIYPDYGSRIRISDLGDKFPENQVTADCYTVDKIHRQEIDEIYKKFKPNSMVGQMKERQRIEEIKIPIIEELANEYLDNGYAVVIFVNFQKSIDDLSKRFNTTCIVCGDQTIEDRESNVEDFQKNIKKLIICNIKAGGLGIDLHDLYGVPRVSLISPSFSSIDFIQTLGRIHRSGSQSTALQRVIYISDTCEEKICENIRNKLQFTSKLNDNDFINF